MVSFGHVVGARLVSVLVLRVGFGRPLRTVVSFRLPPGSALPEGRTRAPKKEARVVKTPLPISAFGIPAVKSGRMAGRPAL